MKYLLYTLLFFSFSATSQENYIDSIQHQRDQHIKELLNPSNQILNEAEIGKIERLDYYPIDSSKKVEAVFVTDKGKSFQLPTSSGTTKTYRRYGYLTFQWNNEPIKLAVYQDLYLSKKTGYEDFLIIPFKDATSGKETYGGGRYLDFQIPAKEQVMIDFNLTYNPYCAYSYRYSCPIPPEENHLTIVIDAGEKTPVEHQ